MAAKLSGSGGGKYQVEANATINVTPFVDVMLVLLIIFMVAAPLAAVTVKVNLPPSTAKETKNPPKPVTLSQPLSTWSEVSIPKVRTNHEPLYGLL